MSQIADDYDNDEFDDIPFCPDCDLPVDECICDEEEEDEEVQ